MSLFFLFAAAICCSQAFCQTKTRVAKQKVFEIEIHDNGLAHQSYNSTEYFLSNRSLTIEEYSEHGSMDAPEYKNKVLLKKQLSPNEVKKLEMFMAAFSLDSLAERYSDNYPKERMPDEEREIYIKIRIGNRSKECQVINCYVRKLGELFEQIDKLIPAAKKNALGIKYSATKF